MPDTVELPTPIGGAVTASRGSLLGERVGWPPEAASLDFNTCRFAKRRIPESAAGFRALLELLAEHSGRSDAPIPVAIETAKGLLPAALQAADYPLFPINPLAVSRYRDRCAVSRAKNDPR